MSEVVSSRLEYENEPSFTIKNSTPEDVEDMERMRHESWVDTYVDDERGVTREMIDEYFTSRLSPDGIAKKKQRTAENLNNPNVLDMVAKDGDGRVVGWLAAIKDGDKKELGAIYTDKKFHGKGIGSELMARGLKFLGDGEIELHVVAYNERAKAFYRKYGFEEVGEPEYTRFKEMPEIKMVRKGAI
ncbi:GNAT family N-acetyltransferase [Candidatus Saccharibacteria bacterium]|nr:GNAT family N-acetyltransferase [Candidatus Saccharibacteria bacterium]